MIQALGGWQKVHRVVCLAPRIPGTADYVRADTFGRRRSAPQRAGAERAANDIPELFVHAADQWNDDDQRRADRVTPIS